MYYNEGEYSTPLHKISTHGLNLDDHSDYADTMPALHKQTSHVGTMIETPASALTLQQLIHYDVEIDEPGKLKN